MKTRHPRARFVFAGSELLQGKLNTYTPELAARLGAFGFTAEGEQTVPDSLEEIKTAAERALASADLVIIVGGLGPTFDDLSREASAAALGRTLAASPALETALRARFKKIGRAMPENNLRQTMLIKGAKPLPNHFGTAPGQYIIVGKKMLMLLPGPLKEWAPMYERYGAAVIKKHFGRGVRTLYRRINITDMAESAADEKLQPVMAKYPQARFTILAKAGDLSFHIYLDCKTPAAGRNGLAAIEKDCRAVLGDSVYSRGEDTLEQALGAVLSAKGWKAATAESCTGGLIASRMTATGGSSQYYQGGVVAYSNEVKMRQLGVSKATLERFGAVSEECAREMARGAMKNLGADCAVATTGIAGPTGATPGKPVGLVYIAACDKTGRTACREYRFKWDRNTIQAYTATKAVNMLRKLVCGAAG